MTEFAEAVAQRVGRPAGEVGAELAQMGIHAYTPRGTAAQLRLTRLQFSGFKDPDADPPTSPFEFEWQLSQGVHALASLRNFVGKTSVLEICRWMLTGSDRHTVGGVDARVRKMLRHVRLEFMLGDEACSVEVDA